MRPVRGFIHRSCALSAVSLLPRRRLPPTVSSSMRTLRRARGLGRESERWVTAEVKVALALRRKEGQDDRSPRSSGGNSSDGFHSRSAAGVRAFRGTRASQIEGKATGTYNSCSTRIPTGCPSYTFVNITRNASWHQRRVHAYIRLRRTIGCFDTSSAVVLTNLPLHLADLWNV